MRVRAYFLASLLLPTAACYKHPPPPTIVARADTEHASVVPPSAGAQAQDPSSYAEPDKVSVKHLALELEVSFDQRVLTGTVTLDLERKDQALDALVLDTRDLSIARVEGGQADAAAGFEPLQFELAARDPVFGSKLTIALPALVSRVRITYNTSPDASGLQWLTPSMTAGGKSAFMFSQSQAIHARSWVPLQDTPGVRFTYEAHIRTPPHLLALMSADNEQVGPRDGDYQFRMPQPIPSYLLALAVGDLVFRPISARSGVWAEPSVVDKAVAEFADTERMIASAESLYGAYRWGRYDVLVLPPSFPFGGMENPRLTFATPTVIVGDKSLVSLIAHELAHSWSGNLVTNASWKDVWLNEGFTSYVESRIVESLYGREAASMENVIGQHELGEELEQLDPKDQLLALAPLVGRDPDDVLTDVAYVKGQWFLSFLEQRYGREAFDPFLRSWFDSHAFTSTDSEEFARFLSRELVDKHPGKTSSAELHAFLHEPGIPSFAQRAESARFAEVDAARTAWLAAQLKPVELDPSTWGTHERVHFLEGLPDTLSRAQLVALDRLLHLSGTANGELAMRWYPLTVQSGYTDARPAMAEFLIKIGRRKLVKPIYSALAKTEDGRSFARQVFEKARAGYHPITRETVEEILAGDQAMP